MSEAGGYADSFLSEARAHLAAMNAALLAAETAPRSRELIDEIFRAAHSVKGMAAMMRREQTAALCHALEDALDAIRKGTLSLAQAADGLFRCLDALGAAIATVESDAPEPELSEAIEELRGLAEGRAGPRAPAGPAEAAGPPIRIDSVAVRMERLDLLMNLAEQLVGAKIRFDALKPRTTVPEVAAAIDQFGRLVTELQYQVTQARLVPVRLIFDRFPRMVRDLARRQDKEVELELQGGELELDRRLAEEIGESLIHLLRNAVDHGVETPEARRAASKPPRGAVRVAATRTADASVIEVEDDGAGLDLEAIAQAAEARGLLPASASKEQVLAAAFAGISTKPRATAVSGRGLGLDIVKRKVESLGGTLSVESRPGRGARFRMEIPPSLAIVKGLLVQVGKRKYALPLAGVEKIVAVEQSQVRGLLEHKAAVIDREEIPLLRLSGIFDGSSSARSSFPIVVLGRGGRRLGLAVDALLSTQDMLLKPLNRLLRGDGRFSGSTIVGTGEAVLVLDPANLLQRARAGAPP